MDHSAHFPDGLSEAVVDALVEEVDRHVVPTRYVPPLYVDREAALRRQRRQQQRVLARVSRTTRCPFCQCPGGHAPSCPRGGSGVAA
ncbi:hypothetical protein GCM10010483_25760 [Actinokineospora diospyrosa]